VWRTCPPPRHRRTCLGHKLERQDGRSATTGLQRFENRNGDLRIVEAHSNGWMLLTAIGHVTCLFTLQSGCEQQKRVQWVDLTWRIYRKVCLWSSCQVCSECRTTPRILRKKLLAVRTRLVAKSITICGHCKRYRATGPDSMWTWLHALWDVCSQSDGPVWHTARSEGNREKAVWAV